MIKKINNAELVQAVRGHLPRLRSRAVPRLLGAHASIERPECAMFAVGGKSGPAVPEPAVLVLNVAADITVHHESGFELAIEERQHHGAGNRALDGRDTQGLGNV